MNKKFVYYLLIIAISGIAIGLIIIFQSGGLVISDSSNRKIYDVDITEVKSLQGIKEISTDGIYADIVVIPEERNDLKIKYYGSVRFAEAPELITNKHGDKFTIKLKKQDQNSELFQTFNLILELHLPQDYSGNMNINSASGNVKTEGELTLKEIHFDLLSGYLMINYLESKKMDINISSGSLTANSLYTEDLKINMLSGDVNLYTFVGGICSIELTSGNLDASTFHTDTTYMKLVSGNLYMKDFQGKLDKESTSGNTRIIFTKLEDDVRLFSSSGDISISLPTAADFFLDARTISGDLNYQFPSPLIGVVKTKNGKNLRGKVGSSKNEIIIEVISGNITIK